MSSAVNSESGLGAWLSYVLWWCWIVLVVVLVPADAYGGQLMANIGRGLALLTAVGGALMIFSGKGRGVDYFSAVVACFVIHYSVT